MKAFRNCKLIALIFGIAALLASCQKDDILEPDTKHFGPELNERAVYLKGSRALKAIRLLKSNMEYSEVGIMSQNSSHMRTGSGWTVDFSEILLINDTLGNHNYTYRVTHPAATEDVFYNLVLTENRRRTTIKLVKYEMSRRFSDGYRSGELGLSQFGGTITFTPIIRNELPDPIPGEPEEPEDPENPGESDNPCEEEVVIEAPDPDPVSGGGGGSGSGSGGGSGGLGTLPEALAPQQPDCWFWNEVPCNGGDGHVGNNPSCKGTFKGATYLVNRCNGQVIQVYRTAMNGDEPVVVADDPCAPVGDIGVLGPELVFDEDEVYYDDGIRPLEEFDDKCEGLARVWELSQLTGNEVAAVITSDGAVLITQILGPSSGGISGIFTYAGVTYYQYPVSQGAPSRHYTGERISAGRYFIPISATVHSHTPCINDGTDGITNNLIDDDQDFAAHCPHANHYIIGCNAIGQFNGESNSAFNIQQGNIENLCENIN